MKPLLAVLRGQVRHVASEFATTVFGAEQLVACLHAPDGPAVKLARPVGDGRSKVREVHLA